MRYNLFQDKLATTIIVILLFISFLIINTHSCTRENNDIKVDKDTVTIKNNELIHKTEHIYVNPSSKVTIGMPHYIKVAYKDIYSVVKLKQHADSVYILTSLPTVHVENNGLQSKFILITVLSSNMHETMVPNINVGVGWNFYFIRRFNFGISALSDLKEVKHTAFLVHATYNLPTFNNLMVYFGFGGNISMDPILSLGVALAL